MIHERSIETTDLDTEARQELDRDFLRTGYRRRLWVANDATFFWRSRPQRSSLPLTLVPIPLGEGGICMLRYRDSDDSVRTVEMIAGRYYYVPPETPYQIESRGIGALEAFTPIPADGRLFDEEVLRDDYFD